MLILCLSILASFLSQIASAQDAAFISADPKYKSVSDQSNKKIGMVISTLKDILQSVVNEEKQETEMFDKYMKWCETESGSIKKDLSDSKTELANTKVLSEEQVSSIDSLTLFISRSEKEIEETKDAIAQAVALRTSENDKYTEEMMLNKQSLRQIDLAIKHVSKVQKQGGFLQNGVLKKLAVNQPGESGYVLGIMKGLNEKLQKTQAELKGTEEEKVKMHNSFLKTKGMSLKSLTDTLTAKKISLSETTAKEAGTKRKIGKLTEQVDQLTKQQADTSSTCSKTKHKWQVRQTDRTKEKAALNEAVRYLTQSSFEQSSMVQQSTEDKNDAEEHASVVFAPSFVQEASDSSISAKEFYAAAGRELDGEDDEVADHMKKDTFNGVKQVVAKLIGTHQDTQQEEKQKRDYCEKEIASNDDAKATTTDNLAAIKASIEKKAAEVEQLGDEVKSLYESIDKIKTGLEEAGKIRKEESTLFKASSKDRALALKVLNQAKTVLQDFYDKKQGNLLQASSSKEAQPASVPNSGRKQSASFGAVSMVQDIADDIAQEQKDAATAEKEADVTFAALQKESRTKTDERHQDITDRVTAKAKLGVQINTEKETQTQTSDELSAITKQLESLHGSCDELLNFFDKRTKGRNFEISQLRDVMDILAGSSINARTGLVQQDEALVDVGSEEGGDTASTVDAQA